MTVTPAGMSMAGTISAPIARARTIAATSPAGLLTTNWTHVVGVVDGVNVILYVNGRAAGSNAWSGTFTPNVNQPLGIGAGPMPGSRRTAR